MSDSERSTGEMLHYLSELRSVSMSVLSPKETRDSMIQRIERVCDSIENDLGLGKGTNDGELTVKLNVDTSGLVTVKKELSALQEAIKEAAPSLVFIQDKGGRIAKVYQDGKQLRGVRSITIRASTDEATTHEIEYVTGYTAKGED
ncbi:MAG: hypothetical protein P0Y55_12130 [Candidatus Cohnella colombiensis]|uniref:Uncharacterized protein n=1 Tax=Candidatus Cohnella colombiensis TaxID=3121368 RepID=A0AA95JBX0_9BACL|nr:MAG: hypothetical protein P0Y55_12130 [Cohnella sp.]